MQIPMFLFAFIAVLALIGVAAWLVRRFGANRLGANPSRGRMPRLAVIDAAAVDGRRRLVLVRRDNVEHLLMIGGPSDIVVEPNIVRATPARDQMAARPVVGGAEPPRVVPLPDPAWAEADGGRADPFDSTEPAMPEPPRPARPSFADEVRRPMAPPLPERRGDPLPGFAPEPPLGRPEPRPEFRPEARVEPRPEPIPSRMLRPERSEPMMPRPQRPNEPPKAPPPVRAPERAVAPPPPPPPPPPPAPPPAASNADANLAEMAQRLEAALRRPAGSSEPAPPVAPEPPPARPARSETPPPPQKSGFENLEDEMASLLGRPKNPS